MQNKQLAKITNGGGLYSLPVVRSTKPEGEKRKISR